MFSFRGISLKPSFTDCPNIAGLMSEMASQPKISEYMPTILSISRAYRQILIEFHVLEEQLVCLVFSKEDDVELRVLVCHQPNVSLLFLVSKQRTLGIATQAEAYLLTEQRVHIMLDDSFILELYNLLEAKVTCGSILKKSSELRFPLAEVSHLEKTTLMMLSLRVLTIGTVYILLNTWLSSVL
jgi:hypothetical protein